MAYIEPARKTNARAEPGTESLQGAIRLFYRFKTPWILSVQALVFAVIRPWLGAPSWADLAIAVGVMLYWPLQEWAAHRTLLHWKPRTVFGFTIDIYAAKAHRYHHRHPWILESTFLPTKMILTIVPIHLLIWWAITPDFARACTGIVLFTLATLFYEWVHYLTHTPYRPKTAYFRRIVRNHRLHHFKNEHHWYAFTAPVVDTVFGTNPDPGDVDLSPTVHTLGVDNLPDPS